MGKLLSLGPRLKYPITISKLLKRPGDDIKKQEPILQYKFTWVQKVGDPFGEQWEENQTTIADWDSPTDGSIKSWKVTEGTVIDHDMAFVDVEETCPHSVQFAGLCAMCGKDMTETSWASISNDTERAKINMIHDQNFLTVSEQEASRAEEELQRRLLKHRKLSLVVDLDQTIIHACIDPTVGEWQNDPTSPNYEAVKDVRSFQLNDDGPRGLALGCWYYIKMRPGLKEFLSKISELYELHVYTMGTRAYALNIAKIVDPDKKLFGDRIISRDENGSMTAKSLARLFPVDTKMVVIIDDRADVWPKNRPNLIKVHPYDFFLGIGDINSSFLPKREEIPKAPHSHKKPSTDAPEEEKPATTNESEAAPLPIGDVTVANGTTSTEPESDETKVSALEELVRMGGGDDQAKRLEQTAEQEKSLEKQLTERPLLQMQEKLDKEDLEEELNGEPGAENNGDVTPEHPHHRHNLLKDDDDELTYLVQHLSQVHKAFYEEYDGALVNAQGGRVAQLKHGHVKKVSMKDDAADLRVVPDVAHVMPTLKRKVLEGTKIVMSGLVPLSTDLMRSEIALQASSFGAELLTKISKKITHLVVPTIKSRTHKVRQAAKYPNIKIVTHQWLADSISKWAKQDETEYLVELSEHDRQHNGLSSVSSSIHDSFGSEEETETMGEEDESDSVPASQEEDDDEGVIPEEFEGGHSPIDDLKTFDWGGADEELAEFMGSDSEDDSDTGSVSSRNSHTSNLSMRGVKRNHNETTDEGESDEGSELAKRQRVSSSRTTGLKTVKTPNNAPSESSLPTPGPTGDDEGQNGELDGDNADDDLEADLMAAFEMDEQDDSDAGS